MLCTTVSAGLTAKASDYSQESLDLELVISGTISPRCEVFLENGNIALDLGTAKGAQNYPVHIDCNEILHIEMVSREGGFKHQTLSGSPPELNGFTAHIPYLAEFSVDAANAQIVRVKSQAMKGTPQGGSTDVIPFRTLGNLRLSWHHDAAPYGGRYSDVIEIRASGKGR